MNPEELEKLKAHLEKIKEELEEELKNTARLTDMGSDVEGASADEETDEAEELGAELGIKRALKERLENVKAALFKLERGSYGYCEKCKTVIESNLLQIDPESRFCRSCKVGQ
jgi:DnaK suppressor protein